MNIGGYDLEQPAVYCTLQNLNQAQETDYSGASVYATRTHEIRGKQHVFVELKPKTDRSEDFANLVFGTPLFVSEDINILEQIDQLKASVAGKTINRPNDERFDVDPIRASKIASRAALRKLLFPLNLEDEKQYSVTRAMMQARGYKIQDALDLRVGGDDNALLSTLHENGLFYIEKGSYYPTWILGTSS